MSGDGEGEIGEGGGAAQRGSDGGAAQRGGGRDRGGGVRGARDGGGADGDGDDGGLVGAEAVAFSKYIVDNWQIIAETPVLFEVHLAAGLDGADLDTLMKGFSRRWTPKVRRNRRFHECDEMRAALKTGDPARIRMVEEEQRSRKERRNRNKNNKRNQRSKQHT